MAETELRCASCNTPILPEVGKKVATCSYCGSVCALPGASAESAGGVPFRAYAFPVARGRSKAVPTVIVLVVVVGLAVTFLSRILGSAWFVFVQEWYSKPCLVDANGDGVLDVAGLAGVSHESARLRLVDGATGKPLWSGQTYSSSAHLVCLSPRFFGIDDVDFRLHLFPARTPNNALEVAMSDRVDKVGLGEDCVAIQFKNRQETSVSFSGTTVSRCDTTGLIEYWGIRKSSDQKTITSNGTVYALTERDPGTPFLIASASNEVGRMWTKELPVVQASDGFSMVSTPQMLVVWGRTTSNDPVGVIVGLDPQTGNLRYAVAQDSHSSDSVFDIGFKFNGRYIIAVWGCGLHAYDPSSGQRLWHIGGR